MIEGIRQLGPLFQQANGRYWLSTLAIAIVAARLLVARRSDTGESPGARRKVDLALHGALALCAVVAVGVYTNFLHFHYGGYLNAYEFYHYYMGSKYFHEVGYFELYNASLVADDETGRLYRPPDDSILDLRTYRFRPVDDVLQERDAYRARFDAERWNEFAADVDFFKHRLGPAAWERILKDKGYNATPAWTALVGPGLSRRVSTESAWGMQALALLDVGLLLLAAAVVWRVFGGFGALLSIVLLGSTYMTAHVHMKGAFLRTDFIVALVLAMCALKTGRHLLAGGLVGYATMSRLFPAVFAFGLLAKLAWDLWPAGRRVLGDLRERWRPGLVPAGLAAGAALFATSAWWLLGETLRGIVARRLGSTTMAIAVLVAASLAVLLAVVVFVASRERPEGALLVRHAHFFGGMAGVAGLLLAISMTQGGPAVWTEYAQKLDVHRGGQHIWDVGFKTLFAADFQPEDAPPGTVTEAEVAAGVGIDRRALAEREALIWILRLLLLAAGFVAARRLDDARALAFGFVPFYLLVAPTYYYYIVLLLPLLYFASGRPTLPRTLGVIYLLVFGMLGFAFYARWDQYFPTTWWNSVLAAGVALAMLAWAIGRGRS
jgi:hypothetical protein